MADISLKFETVPGPPSGLDMFRVATAAAAYQLHQYAIYERAARDPAFAAACYGDESPGAISLATFASRSLEKASSYTVWARQIATSTLVSANGLIELPRLPGTLPSMRSDFIELARDAACWLQVDKLDPQAWKPAMEWANTLAVADAATERGPEEQDRLD